MAYACTRCLENYCANCGQFRVNEDPECLLCGAPITEAFFKARRPE